MIIRTEAISESRPSGWIIGGREGSWTMLLRLKRRNEFIRAYGERVIPRLRWSN